MYRRNFLSGLSLLVGLLGLSGCNQNNTHLALGTLERDRIAHTATVNEVVVLLPVAAGEWVEKGTLLVQLDNRQQLAQVARAEASVAEAEARLDKLRNGARVEEVAAASARREGAQAALVESRASYVRAKNLADRDLASQAALDSTRAARDGNLAALRSAEEELRKLTNGTRPEDLRIGEAHLMAVQASLTSENKKLADLTIRATRAGLLDNLPWNLGERVTTGSPVAIVLAGVAPYARVYVPEPYRVQVAVGDLLQVSVDGIQAPIEGRVRWISSDPAFSPYYALNQEERARLMYLAEIQLPDSAKNLPNGVPAQVHLP